MKILEIFENKLRYKNYSQNTIKTYKQTLYQYFKETNCKDPYRISTKEILNYLETKYFTSISQQNQFIGCLKLFARFILNKKDIHLDKIERPRGEKKLPKIIEKEFLLDKLSKIENLKHKSILTLAYSTGMRVSEVCNLKIEDIDSKRMLIHVKNSKGRKDRVLPLSSAVLILLREYFRSFKPDEYLFKGQNNPKYSHKSCNEIVRKYIGKEYHFHLIRHSHATALLEHILNNQIAVVIIKALNDGWIPDWNDDNQYKYYPYFIMNKDDFRYYDYFNFFTYSSVSSRLAYLNKKNMLEAVELYLDIYKKSRH